MGHSLARKNRITEEAIVDILRQGIAEDKSTIELAIKLNTSPATICNWMQKHGIIWREKLRGVWLLQEYVDKRRSANSIAIELGVTPGAVIWHLKKRGIDIRKGKEAQATRVDILNKRSCPNNSTTKVTGPFGYCFWFAGTYCLSTAEYIFLKKNRHNAHLKAQPFVFQNRRPDFLVDNRIVVEVKDERRSVSKKELLTYFDYGLAIKKEFGFSYEIQFMRELYRREYENALDWLRKYATRGRPFCLLEEI